MIDMPLNVNVPYVRAIQNVNWADLIYSHVISDGFTNLFMRNFLQTGVFHLFRVQLHGVLITSSLQKAVFWVSTRPVSLQYRWKLSCFLQPDN